MKLETISKDNFLRSLGKKSLRQLIIHIGPTLKKPGFIIFINSK